MNRWTRKIHRWGALLIAAPLLLVIITGLMLQVKKEVPWIQPPTVRGTSEVPSISFEEILEQLKTVSESSVTTWDDVERIDVQPGKGVMKVQAKNRYEVQLDLADGKILAVKYRRSDLIESLHDGSFFADFAKLWIFLPSGIVLLILWFTGAWLWWLPIQSRRKKKARLNSR